MRIIERKLKTAFEAGKELYISNSMVKVENEIVSLYLFGHCIAMRNTRSNQTCFTLAGWNTSTTRSRLRNVLGIGVYNNKRVPHIGMRKLDSRAWYAVAPEFCEGFRTVTSDLEELITKPTAERENTL